MGVRVTVAEVEGVSVGVIVVLPDTVAEVEGVSVGVTELDGVTVADCVKGAVIDPKGEAVKTLAVGL